MSINLKKIYEKVAMIWDNLDFEIKKIDKDAIYFNANVTIDKLYDDDITIRIIVFKNNELCIEFVFDELAKNLENLKLVNEFNENVYTFKAYIDEDGFFDVEYVSKYKDEQDAVDEIGFVFTAFADGEVFGKYLQAITKKTK